ncbi:MAG: sodium-dependent bicarbonate transport family permease [Planctomycetia bacterium]|nr:sodium-dependent bicarbonate transport family permease [Planctomycetia bacterium]
MLQDFLTNVSHNLFKPLLLFFYAGFAIPLLRVKFEFPKVLYQGLTIYLLLAIGWHGGEELAGLEPEMYGQAAGFMVVGFFTNLIIGIVAFASLRAFTKLRKIDAATVAGYYGSDSAGTFVTCLGVMTAANIAFAPYMPVMLAIMEIPGCLVALFIVSKMRNSGMDALGNMPGEEGFSRFNRADGTKLPAALDEELDEVVLAEDEELVAAGSTTKYGSGSGNDVRRGRGNGANHGGSLPDDEEVSQSKKERQQALDAEDDIALRSGDSKDGKPGDKKAPLFSGELLHEVFLNPGIYLLFAGIAIGFISRLQGAKVIAANDMLFNNLFQGMLSLFLLEMGMTAARKLKDLKAGGWQFVAFALIAPNVFATFGMIVAHFYGIFSGHPLEQGTYVLFAVLCGAASYIALPAVQRMAIPEASPTLPLAASLGLTFSYNVTIGIPVYMEIAKMLMRSSA